MDQLVTRIKEDKKRNTRVKTLKLAHKLLKLELRALKKVVDKIAHTINLRKKKKMHHRKHWLVRKDG